MTYDPTIYLGSATHYRYGRPPYSALLETTLADALGLDGSGRLLDVGCGPGTLAIRLAKFFEETIGVEPDPDMLAEARRWAAEEGIERIRWVQGLAEALPGVAPGPYRLVTFGQSFHWTNEERVAEIVYDMLEPGGAMALIVHTVDGRPVPAGPDLPRIPHDAMRSLVEEYLGARPRVGSSFAPVRTHRFEDVLVRTRFGQPSQLFVDGRPDVVRDVESVLSGYLSFATSAPHLFGDRLDEFCHRARALLWQVSPTGLFWDWPGDTEIVLAHRAAVVPGA